jgi:hypothetical protein
MPNAAAENLDGFPDAETLRIHLEAVKGSASQWYIIYGYAKALAMEARIKGDISIATEKERRCDQIYPRIPAQWRCW